MTPDQAQQIMLLTEDAAFESGDCIHDAHLGLNTSDCRRCQARRKLAQMVVIEREAEQKHVTGWYVTRLDRDNDGYPTSEPWDDRVFLSEASARDEADKLQASAEAAQRAKYDQAKRTAERAVEEHNALVNAGLRTERRALNSYPEFKRTLQFDISDVEVHP